tara:strand:- start:212 stop:415 length:204 start_codon:yes stop_codon:yes gene_type:complete
MKIINYNGTDIICKYNKIENIDIVKDKHDRFILPFSIFRSFQDLPEIELSFLTITEAQEYINKFIRP